MTEYCFACGKPLKAGKSFLVDTRDDQTVYVGPECYKRVVEAGEEGYKPAKYKGKVYKNVLRLWEIK